MRPGRWWWLCVERGGREQGEARLGFGQNLSPPLPAPCQMMLPVFLGERVPPETLASTLAELDRCLQLLEDKFLKDDNFLAGPCISVADLVAITELMHVSARGGVARGAWGAPEGASVPAHAALPGCGPRACYFLLGVLICKMGLGKPHPAGISRPFPVSPGRGPPQPVTHGAEEPSPPV